VFSRQKIEFRDRSSVVCLAGLLADRRESFLKENANPLKTRSTIFEIRRYGFFNFNQVHLLFDFNLFSISPATTLRSTLAMDGLKATGGMWSPSKHISRSPGAVTVPQYLISLFSLEGTTVLVTGGTRGVGPGLTIALASAGADIILLVRDLHMGNSLKHQIAELGRNVSLFQCDLSSKADLKKIIGEVLSQGLSPDILLNCGGALPKNAALETSDDAWDEVVQINLNATWVLSRDLAKHWKRQIGGHIWRKIINVSSVMGIEGCGKGAVAYAAAKGGITQLTKALSNEWAEMKINVNAIAPGYIKSDLAQALHIDPEMSAEVVKRTPVGRWGTPTDLAGAVVYLASQASNFVNGETHIVDGGYSWSSN